MNAIASDARALNSSPREAVGDPLRLVTVGDIYPKRIHFGAPIWVSLVAFAVEWMATSISCVPVIPVQPVFRKVAARVEMLAAVTLMGGIVLQNLTL